MGDPLLDVFVILFIGLPMAAFARWKKRGLILTIVFCGSIYIGTIVGCFYEIVVIISMLSLIVLFFLPNQCPKCKLKLKKQEMKKKQCENCGSIQLKKAWMFLFFLIVVFFLLPGQIVVRKNMIRNEGKKIIKLIENYKNDYKTYPEKLEQLGVMIRYYPQYSKKDNQRYILVYKIFGFLRWSYDPTIKKWKILD